MNNLLESLVSQFGGQAIGALTNQIGGTNQNQTQSGISAALPALIGALTRNTSNENGAASLFNALNKDHDGGILDNLSGFFEQGGNKQDGAGILSHLLGDKRQAVEQHVSQNSGLDSSSTSNLLEMLAPVVMGFLGKNTRQGGLDIGGLANLIGGFNNQVQQQQPEQASIFSKLLDQNGDGNIMDDVTNIGMNLFKNFMK